MVWGTKANNENLVPFFELPIDSDLNMGELQVSQSRGELQVSQSRSIQQCMLYWYEAILYNCIPTLLVSASKYSKSWLEYPHCVTSGIIISLK